MLFNFPTRYLFAVGLAVISRASGGVYHRLEATLSSSPTLGSERRALNGLAEVGAPATGLSPSPGGRVPADFGAGHTVLRRRRPPPERHIPTDPLGSRVRRLALPFSFAITGGIPFGFLFLRSMICLSSAGDLARFQVDSPSANLRQSRTCTRGLARADGLTRVTDRFLVRSQEARVGNGGARHNGMELFAFFSVTGPAANHVPLVTSLR